MGETITTAVRHGNNIINSQEASINAAVRYGDILVMFAKQTYISDQQLKANGLNIFFEILFEIEQDMMCETADGHTWRRAGENSGALSS